MKMKPIFHDTCNVIFWSSFTFVILIILNGDSHINYVLNYYHDLAENK